MPEAYYEREPIVHLDGSPVFQNAGDRAIEDGRSQDDRRARRQNDRSGRSHWS